MKYTRRLKIIWFAFLLIVAFSFLAQDFLGRSLGMDTAIYAVLFMFLFLQLRDIIKHNDEE
ncbi:hypothetical protein AOC36_02760 [Erysipelothrix larvae]|uniref:Uncharacterized protein n=1 Tax=Erysipelothrix larvae TaxID=1514105 RepID=A0A109UGQ1_9FIRM|nr:hypothetical protein AOC36_02760 [Erysipelothrix larvae]